MSKVFWRILSCEKKHSPIKFAKKPLDFLGKFKNFPRKSKTPKRGLLPKTPNPRFGVLMALCNCLILLVFF